MPFNCFKQKPMKLWESLRLSPYQKWKKYGRFPTKFLVNLLILVATTWQVSFSNNTIIPYQRAQNTNWQALLQPGEEPDSTSIRITSHLKTVDDLVYSVTLARDTYYNLQNTSVDLFEYLPNDDNPDATVMVLKRFKDGSKIFDLSIPFNDEESTETFFISPTDLGPFSSMSGAELNSFVHTLKHFTLTFDIRNFDVSGNTRICYIETVTSHYSFEIRGRISLEVFPSSRFCEEEFDVKLLDRGYDWSLALFLSLVILCLATFSQILQFKSIRKHIRIYQMSKDIYHQGRHQWESLTISDKLKFFNVWFIVASIGNISNIVGPIISLRQLVVLNSHVSFRVTTFFSGLGCMFAWILMIQYFEHSTSYYVLVLTLKRGTPRVLKFLIGVLPVFLGYAIFGVAMFSDTSVLFADLDQSAVTLYALLNGDVIHDVFDAIYNASPIISRIYLYSFIALFIYAILNIFVAIVEDSFFASKAFSLSETEKSANNQTRDKLESIDIMSLLEGPPVDINTPRGNVAAAEDDLGQGNLQTPLLRDEEDFQLYHNGDAGLRINTKDAELEDDRTNMLKESIHQIQQAFNREFEQAIHKQLVESGALSNTPLRPPHDPSFFPCEFPDCIHCKIRSSFIDASKHINSKVSKVLKGAAVGTSKVEQKSDSDVETFSLAKRSSFNVEGNASPRSAQTT